MASIEFTVVAFLTLSPTDFLCIISQNATNFTGCQIYQMKILDAHLSEFQVNFFFFIIGIPHAI